MCRAMNSHERDWHNTRRTYYVMVLDGKYDWIVYDPDQECPSEDIGKFSLEFGKHTFFPRNSVIVWG